MHFQESKFDVTIYNKRSYCAEEDAAGEVLEVTCPILKPVDKVLTVPPTVVPLEAVPVVAVVVVDGLDMVALFPREKPERLEGAVPVEEAAFAVAV